MLQLRSAVAVLIAKVPFRGYRSSQKLLSYKISSIYSRATQLWQNSKRFGDKLQIHASHSFKENFLLLADNYRNMSSTFI